MKRVLAFDLGASSGRAMLACYNDGRIEMEEVHRFTNEPVKMRDTLYWDLPRLFNELKLGIRQAVKRGGFSSIGIDTWGVDFGILDKHGDLISNPVHYRDKRTAGIMEKVSKSISLSELYQRTGIQPMHINTIFQLCAICERSPELLSGAGNILMMPDLLAYLLCGKKRAERTIASTTGLYNAVDDDWDWETIDLLGLPDHIFPRFISAGDTYGYLTPAICEELGCEAVPVVAIGAHDTASAVAAVPVVGEDSFAFLSCGTWSLFGAQCKTPIINDNAFEAGFTNECGIAALTSGGNCRYSVRFLRNIIGLWLIQESRRQWIREGLEEPFSSFDALEKEARAADVTPFLSFIDPDDPMFEAPGDLPQRIRTFCKDSGQHVPEGRGELLRCIYQSMALKYRHSLCGLETVTDTDFPILHMVGGGIKDTLLCEMTASACNLTVKAGPIEATAMGNVGIQLIAAKELDNLAALRKASGNSFNQITYLPVDTEGWDAAYEKFVSIIN